jgi:ribosome-associated heat shock protein Hsp15
LSSPEEQRLDKWLWHARFVKSRSLAAKLIEAGCVRVNRQRVVKAATCVKCGDVLTATLHGRIRVIEILSLGHRRGPPSEAQALYAELLPSQAAQLETAEEDLM